MCGVSWRWSRPFAVGVLALDGDVASDEDQRRRARLDLALDTYVLGYFLVDTVEVRADGSGYPTAEALAMRTRADAFVVRGPAQLSQLERTAARLRMTIRAFDTPATELMITREAVLELRGH